MDVWDTKNMFRISVSKIISQENAVTDTMADLESNVIQAIKDWIVINQPLIFREDRPWKIYLDRQINVLGLQDKASEQIAYS